MAVKYINNHNLIHLFKITHLQPAVLPHQLFIRCLGQALYILSSQN